MIEFAEHLEQHVTALLQTAVGPTAATPKVVTFDNYLHDVELPEFPYLVVAVRTAETSGSGEMGTNNDLWTWTVHIYYLDTTEVYATGKTKRANILSRIEHALEQDRRLGNCEVVSSIGREYVYDSQITAITFDYTGEEEYHSFVSELYLNVATAKS